MSFARVDQLVGNLAGQVVNSWMSRRSSGMARPPAQCGRKAQSLKKRPGERPGASWLAQPRQAIGLIVILESNRDDGS